MEVMNCKGCGRIFNYIGGQKLCQACKDALEAKFQEVKAYIRENKITNITQVSEATDCPVNQIKQWVREERLCFQEGSGVGIECENCGAEIMTGRFCAKCKTSMVNQFGSLYQKQKVEPKKPARDKDRIRFLDNK